MEMDPFLRSRAYGKARFIEVVDLTRRLIEEVIGVDLDDEPVVCERLKASFQREGHAIEIFVDPKEALGRLAEKNFDIVVTDLRMGEISGLEVLAGARVRGAVLGDDYAARGEIDGGAFA